MNNYHFFGSNQLEWRKEEKLDDLIEFFERAKRKNKRDKNARFKPEAFSYCLWLVPNQKEGYEIIPHRPLVEEAILLKPMDDHQENHWNEWTKDLKAGMSKV